MPAFSPLLFALLFITTVANAAPEVMGNITYQRQGEQVADGTPAAIFPHWVHRVRYKCYVCHFEIYQMQAGSDKASMQDIIAGKSCGVCHNGKIAWNIKFDTCSRCHRAEE